MWASPSNKNSEGSQSSGRPAPFCEFYFLMLYNILTVNREKNPFMLLVGEEESKPF